MKRRFLLLTVTLIPAVALLIGFVVTRSGGTDEVATGNLAPVDSAAGSIQKDQNASREQVEVTESVPPDAVGIKKTVAEKPRRPALDDIPAHEMTDILTGVSRIDEVLFEEVSEPDERGLRQRVRVLKTDFHFPLVQTIELLERDSATGEQKVAAYQAMVADHVMVQIDTTEAPAQWEEQLSLNDVTLREQITKDGLYIMEFPVEKADAASEVIDSLRAEYEWVRFAEPDFLITSLATDDDEEEVLPNDPNFDDMWGLSNTGQQGGVAGQDINALEAWKVRTDASNVIVAVIDTGIDSTHIDLKPNMWVNPREIPNNNIDDDGNGYVDDIHGIDVVTRGTPEDFEAHGTHVAGTIGAVGDNQEGVVGVAWNVQLMAVKILTPGGTLSHTIRGIDYAWENGAQILNNSWGTLLYNSRMFGTWRSEAMADAILRTRNAGAIFVTAAGNDFTDVDIYPDFPAGHQAQADNVVNVAALDRSGGLAFFSNYGVNNVQIAAPGHEILSTVPGNGYASFSGTSMAAPHVAGMLALMVAEYGDPYDAIIQRLYRTSLHNPRIARHVQGGRFVDLGAALDPAPVIYAPLPETYFRPGTDDSVTLSVGASGKGALSYKWFKDGDDDQLPGETGPDLVITNPNAGDAGLYRVEVSNAFGEVWSEARLRQAVGDSELAEALKHPHVEENWLEWFSDKAAPWSPVTVDGEPAAQSGDIGHLQESDIKTIVAGPGTLTFSWKVSSEKIYDVLEFRVGGVVKETISGETGWLNRTYAIPPGQQEIIWRYSKDGSDPGSSDVVDGGWLKKVRYDPKHPVILSQSPSQDVVAGSSVTLEVTALGSSVTYFWEKDGALLSGETENALTFSEIDASAAGSYVVTVANSHGVTSSSAMTIHVVGEAAAPAIVYHPQNVSATEGEEVVLWSEFVATSPWEAQWYKDGEVLPGANGSSLNLGTLTAEKSGSYTLKVTNDIGFEESLSAVVTVLPPVESFADWLDRMGGLEAVEQVSGSVDPLMLFALGIEPGAPVASHLPKVAVVPGAELQMSGDFSASEGAHEYLALVFERPRSIEGIAYRLEVSSDLNVWEEVDALVEYFDLPGGARQLVQLREAEPLDSDRKKRFLRMKVENVD